MLRDSLRKTHLASTGLKTRANLAEGTDVETLWLLFSYLVLYETLTTMFSKPDKSD